MKNIFNPLAVFTKLFTVNYVSRLIAETEAEYYAAVRNLQIAKVQQARINSSVAFETDRVSILSAELETLKGNKNETNTSKPAGGTSIPLTHSERTGR